MKRALIALAVLAVIAPLLGLMAFAALFSDSGGGAVSADCPSPSAPVSTTGKGLIPSNLIPIYKAAEKKYGVPWSVLAAINKVETGFGRLNMTTSPAGAIGWMQFMPGTWAIYGVDGNRDGRKDPYNPIDAIFSAANMLKQNHADTNLHDAIFLYNHAEWYVQEVLDLARSFAVNPDPANPVELPGVACRTVTGIPGKVIIAPGANLPGKPVQAVTLGFIAQVAGLYGKPLICTTGTNHSQFTVDGNVSDHFFGNACDIGMNANGGFDDSPVGDAIAAACLEAAGDPPSTAIPLAVSGGLFNRVHNGLRIQCIWKTYLGGNHHNHVHIGARPA